VEQVRTVEIDIIEGRGRKVGSEQFLYASGGVEGVEERYQIGFAVKTTSEDPVESAFASATVECERDGKPKQEKQKE
jgi:hypothetical protein